MSKFFTERISATQGAGVRVIVDVGGTTFSTSLYTLDKYPDSMFGSLIAKEKEQLGDESVLKLFGVIYKF